MEIDPKKLLELTKLLKDLMRLPPAGRSAMAAALYESLEDAVDADDEDVWGVEIRRRIAAIDAGREELVRWAENRKSILGR